MTSVGFTGTCRDCGADVPAAGGTSLSGAETL